MRQLPYMVKAFRLIWNTAPGWTFIWMVILVVQGLLPVAIVYLTKAIIDSLVVVVGVGEAELWQNYKLVLIPVGMMVGVLLLTAILRSALNIIRAEQSQIVQDKISTLIQEKSVALDLSFYESAEYLDKLHRAQNDASHRPVELVESLSTLLQNSITLVAMASVLLPFGIWAPGVLVLSTLPVLHVVLKHRLRYFNLNYKNTQHERRAWYYNWLLTSRENAAEIKMFELGNYFRSAFYSLRETLRKEKFKLNRSQAFAELSAALFALLITGCAMGWMVWRAIVGTATMGDLALFYQAFNQGQKLMRSLLENVGQMYSSSLFLGDLFEFFDLEPQICDSVDPQTPPVHLENGITFDNVDFRYPFGQKLVLQGFNLTLKAGKITALVGANGTGKSTLIKLLCRLYDPESGKIFFDDIDIKQSKVRDIRRMITVLFQEPVRFNATVAENIGLSNLAKHDDKILIDEAAQASGADTVVSKLPEGYETLLGRWFAGSTDLSGGEWQRIALARAFLRKSPIIILDEPTSSMDSWSEMDWVKRFRQLASGRTAIIIAHRFTTAMQADIIHVMDNGRIVESGSHDELLSLGGRYAASWKEQMRCGSDAQLSSS